MEKVFHHYLKWEDREFGMYEVTCFMDSDKMREDCETLLKCPEWLYESMVFVSYHWQYSSEQNLTNMNRNRQAWLGQAACCFSHGAPEYITKQAWNNLSEQEMKKANQVADQVISMWENAYIKGAHSWQK